MTNSRIVDKRQRLIDSAADLLHRQGAAQTTLAQIAKVADVPLGNVYYYFKTRDDLVDAVIEHWQSVLDVALRQLEGRRTPKARLKGLAELWTSQADSMVQDGCPVGGLTYELNKGHDSRAVHVRALLDTILTWAEARFRELEMRDPRGLAVHLLSAIQGAVLLANTFNDVSLLQAEVRRLDRWIDEIG